jgi:MSHA pilin protein MshC
MAATGTAAGRRVPAPAGGYTLVELVVVVVVLGIVALVAGPRFFGTAAFAERGYADELAGALLLARQVAVASGCPVQLTLSADGYVVTQQAAAGNACDPADAGWSTPVLGPDGAALAGTAPPGTVTNPGGSFRFDAEGKLAAAPAASIGVGGHSITIVAATGLVEVQ